MTIKASAAIAAGILALAVASAPLEAQDAVRVPRSVLQRYVGEYVQGGSTVKVSLSGDTLFREVPGQRVMLYPISETMFRMGPVFTAEFVIDESRNVTQILTDGVEIEYRLPRKGSRAAPPPAPPAARSAFPGGARAVRRDVRIHPGTDGTNRPEGRGPATRRHAVSDAGGGCRPPSDLGNPIQGRQHAADHGVRDRRGRSDAGHGLRLAADAGSAHEQRHTLTTMEADMTSRRE